MRFAALLVLAACASSSESARSVDNVGEVCASSSTAGAPLVLSYTGPCVSSSCTADRVAHCDVVQLDPTTIRVSAHADWSDFTKDMGVCTRDCAAFSTTCTTPDAVAAGTYTLVFGDSTMTLTIPQSTPTCMKRY